MADVQEQIAGLVRDNEIVLFMKGNRRFPQCGFSATVVRILDGLVREYKTVNVLEDPAIRDGVKAFSNWPTIPQLYVKGQFVGGCDIVKEMAEAGELADVLGVQAPAAVIPKFAVTPAAAKAFSEAKESDAEQPRVIVSPEFRYELFFDAKKKADVEVESQGLKFLFDPESARRADGMTVDFVEGEKGGFRIVNPNEPARVKSLSVRELKAMMDRSEKVTLFDVRTAAERSTAKLSQAIHFDDDGKKLLDGLAKDAPIVFQCHHGGRSRAAAEEAIRAGYRNVWNLEGGIDAWSKEIDPSIARY